MAQGHHLNVSQQYLQKEQQQQKQQQQQQQQQQQTYRCVSMIHPYAMPDQFNHVYLTKRPKT